MSMEIDKVVSDRGGCNWGRAGAVPVTTGGGLLSKDLKTSEIGEPAVKGRQVMSRVGVSVARPGDKGSPVGTQVLVTCSLRMSRAWLQSCTVNSKCRQIPALHFGPPCT